MASRGDAICMLNVWQLTFIRVNRQVRKWGLRMIVFRRG
jgi:hypothetical protein